MGLMITMIDVVRYRGSRVRPGSVQFLLESPDDDNKVTVVTAVGLHEYIYCNIDGQVPTISKNIVLIFPLKMRVSCWFGDLSFGTSSNRNVALLGAISSASLLK